MGATASFMVDPAPAAAEPLTQTVQILIARAEARKQRYQSPRKVFFCHSCCAFSYDSHFHDRNDTDRLDVTLFRCPHPFCVPNSTRLLEEIPASIEGSLRLQAIMLELINARAAARERSQAGKVGVPTVDVVLGIDIVKSRTELKGEQVVCSICNDDFMGDCNGGKGDCAGDYKVVSMDSKDGCDDCCPEITASASSSKYRTSRAISPGSGSTSSGYTSDSCSTGSYPSSGRHDSQGSDASSSSAVRILNVFLLSVFSSFLLLSLPLSPLFDVSPHNCYDYYSELQENSIMKLECGHGFHESCIMHWFEAHRTCPCCRTNVTQFRSIPTPEQLAASFNEEQLINKVRFALGTKSFRVCEEVEAALMTDKKEDSLLMRRTSLNVAQTLSEGEGTGTAAGSRRGELSVRLYELLLKSNSSRGDDNKISYR